ncbi:hypothetical protein FACS189459_0370 [Bacilli bacterium]|nr:hypothetical protein FACS189459_0370 [Bacilli bacterium]
MPSQTYFQFTGTKGENISVADLGGTFTKDGDITPPRPISVLLDFPGALTDGKATVSGQAPKLSGTFHISFLLYDTYIVQNFDVTVQ